MSRVSWLLWALSHEVITSFFFWLASRGVRWKGDRVSAYHEAAHALAFRRSGVSVQALVMPRLLGRGGKIKILHLSSDTGSYGDFIKCIAAGFAGMAADAVFSPGVFQGKEHDETGVYAGDIQYARDVARHFLSQCGRAIGPSKGDCASSGADATTDQSVERWVGIMLRGARVNATRFVSREHHRIELLADALVERGCLSSDDIDHILNEQR